MNNNQNENSDSKLETLELDKEVKNESSLQVPSLVEKIEEIENKLFNLEKQNKNDTTNAIKSIGYISVVISLGLTTIVSLIVVTKSNFEWWQFLVAIGVIFIGMIIFFCSSICLIFRYAEKYTKTNNKKNSN